MAVSLALPNEMFDQIRDSGGKVKGEMARTLDAAAESAAKYAQTLSTLPVPEGLTVHNLNYTPPDTTEKKTRFLPFANSLKLNSLFAE